LLYLSAPFLPEVGCFPYYMGYTITYAGGLSIWQKNAPNECLFGYLYGKKLG